MSDKVDEYIKEYNESGNFDANYINQLKRSLKLVQKSQKIFKQKIEEPKTKFVSLIVGQLVHPVTGMPLKLADVYKGYPNDFIESNLADQLKTIQNLINGHEKILSIMTKLTQSEESSQVANYVSGKVEKNPFSDEINPFNVVIDDERAGEGEDSEDSEDSEDVINFDNFSGKNEKKIDPQKEDDNMDKFKEMQKMLNIGLNNDELYYKSPHHNVSDVCKVVKKFFHIFFSSMGILHHGGMERLAEYLEILKRKVPNHCGDLDRDDVMWDKIVDKFHGKIKKSHLEKVNKYRHSTLKERKKFQTNLKGIVKRIKTLNANHVDS